MTIALRLARTTRFLLTAGLLSVAVGLTAARYWLLPKVDGYRQSLQTTASQTLGQPLRIGGLSAHMRGFSPELALHDVAVVDAGSGAINVWLGGVYLGLDVWHWLSSGELRTGWITVQGADLNLLRLADGDIVLEGIRSQAGLPPWLFEYGRFELLNSRVRWSDAAGGPTLDFSRVDFDIANDGTHHRINADLTTAGDHQRLRLRADLDGSMQQPAELNGQVYLHGQHLHLESWPLPTWGGYGRLSGNADFRLWADWRDGGLQSLAGWSALSQVEMHYRATSADCLLDRPEGCLTGVDVPLALAGIDGWFRWRRADGGWEWQTTRLRLNPDGKPWPETRVSLAYQAGNWRAAADYLQLADLAALLHEVAPTLALDGLATLDTLSLRGELRDLSLTYGNAGDGQAQYGLCVTFRNVGLEAYAAWPGLTGASGKLCGNDRSAAIDLAAGPGALSIPNLFRAPIAYTTATGRLSWRRDDQAWSLSGDDLHLQTPDSSSTSRFRLSRRPGDASPFLDWRARLEGGNIAGTSHYLPTPLMSKASVEWLDAAFLAGKIVTGDVLWRGPLAAYPFPNGEGIFRASASVSDARIRFAEGWLPLTDFSTDAVFEGDGLTLRNGQGRLGETAVSDMQAGIDHMGADGVLTIAGRVEGSLPQIMDYFAQTPRAALIDTIKAHADAEGYASSDLLLGMAFDGPEDAMDVRGEARIVGGRLNLAQNRYSLDGIDGSVRFENGRIEANALTARAFGMPAKLALHGDGVHLHAIVDSHGDVSTVYEQLAGQTAAPIPIKGGLAYQAALTIPQQHFDTSSQGLKLDVSGDLLDTAVDLPPPFAKASGVPGFAHLTLDWDDKNSLALRGDYGFGSAADPKEAAKFQTRLSKDANGHWRADGGEWALGDLALTNKPPTQGWRIAGRLAALPLDVWWKRLQDEPSALSQSAKIQQIDLAIAQPRWEDRDWEALAVNLSRDADGWSGRWTSGFAVGKLRLPPTWPSEQPVALDLERLVLPSMPKETLERARQAQIAPTQLPTLTLHAQHLLWQGHDLGRFDCATERQEAGLRLKQCSLEAELQQAGLSGEWRRSDDRDFSRLDGKMKIKDLGKLLEQLGVGDDVVHTPTRLKFSLQWQDAPQRLALSKLNGDVAVNLGQGSLRHFDPGLARALGLFNIETLKRRMLLDFSDVFEEGFAYDKVTGTFNITDGRATTPHLLIDGPSARVLVNGTVDLARRTLDQQITVLPRTSLAWPILGTLAGGPAVGAAALLAQQLVGEKLEGFTASQYAINGDWDNPNVVQLSHNMPMEMLLRVWQGVKDISKFNEPEDNNE